MCSALRTRAFPHSRLPARVLAVASRRSAAQRSRLPHAVRCTSPSGGAGNARACRRRWPSLRCRNGDGRMLQCGDSRRRWPSCGWCARDLRGGYPSSAMPVREAGFVPLWTCTETPPSQPMRQPCVCALTRVCARACVCVRLCARARVCMGLSLCARACECRGMRTGSTVSPLSTATTHASCMMHACCTLHARCTYVVCSHHFPLPLGVAGSSPHVVVVRAPHVAAERQREKGRQALDAFLFHFYIKTGYVQVGLSHFFGLVPKGSVCVCVCVCARARARVVCMRAQARVCVCLCVCARAWVCGAGEGKGR
jgi:hypothetical protein